MMTEEKKVSFFEKSILWIKESVEKEVTPSVALAIGVKDQLLVKQTFGFTSVTAERSAVNPLTLYDMASVSKMMSTSMSAFRMLASGQINLQVPISHYLGQSVPKDKQDITIQHLMTHTSGLPPYVMLCDKIDDAKAALPYVLSIPLQCKPGTKTIYSCMGFILLGMVLEAAAHQSLDIIAREQVFAPLSMTHTGYCPLQSNQTDKSNIAFTEQREGKWLIGEVHDENASFLGGVSGNAGVFSNLDDCIRFASMLAQLGVIDGKTYLPQELLISALHTVPAEKGLHYALGFKVNTADRFDGGLFPNTGFGHFGFTGTEIVADAASGLYVVLLQNRVHPTRDNTQALQMRQTLNTLAAIDFAEYQKSQ
ncbi:MAG: beta-lactamase family protein [Clostridiales bacterium]|nr:beta-lactamase family protein [Clostridiales bacterium]